MPFKVYEIKNANRRGKDAKKIEPITDRNALFQKRDEERTVPYFSIVIEQFLKDDRLKKLTRNEQGLFLLLCIDIWREGARFNNHPEGNADRMDIDLSEWLTLRDKLINTNLLMIDSKKIYLVQPELREQYLQYIISHSSYSTDTNINTNDLDG